MSMQRITITIPGNIYDDLIKLVPSGKISNFAAKALEKELTKQTADPVEAFISLRETKIPRRSKVAILKAINKGRK